MSKKPPYFHQALRLESKSEDHLRLSSADGHLQVDLRDRGIKLELMRTKRRRDGVAFSSTIQTIALLPSEWEELRGWLAWRLSPRRD